MALSLETFQQFVEEASQVQSILQKQLTDSLEIKNSDETPNYVSAGELARVTTWYNNNTFLIGLLSDTVRMSPIYPTTWAQQGEWTSARIGSFNVLDMYSRLTVALLKVKQMLK